MSFARRECDEVSVAVADGSRLLALKLSMADLRPAPQRIQNLDCDRYRQAPV